MATIGNSTPLLYVEGSATQTGASGTQRTVKITARFKVNGSGGYYYGYPCSWRARVHTSYGSYVSFKGNETWYGSDGLRTFEQTLTVDVGTTNSTNITVGIYTNNSTYNYWNGSYTWTFGVGSTNVAPTLSGTIDTNPSGTINESISKIDLTSPTASDGNNNLSGYRFAVSVNGGGYSEIYKGSSRTYTHSISGGEGTTYKYSCYAYDASNATSSTIYSNTVTKNTLTGGSFTGHSNDIDYNTTSFTLNFGGGSNTNGAGVKYLCYSDTVIVYNQQETTSGSQTIAIWKSGGYPSGPYIKFDDLKSFFASSNYNGRLHVGLRTGNEYGTYKWAGGSIGVDLRVNPPAPSNAVIASTSTIWKTVASTGAKYLIPDGSGRISVDWKVVSGGLGESIIYEVYVAYGSGGWNYLGGETGVNGDTAYHHHYIERQTTSQAIKYLVRARTNYGYYTDSITPEETLHYYNTPGLIQGTLTRGATTADVKITVKTNSSIPNIGTVGSWLTSPTTVSGNLTNSQSEQNIAITGLTDSGTYTLKVTYNDNTGFSSNQTANIAIGQNSPIFFVNKFGVGVNGHKADSDFSLVVNGRARSAQGPFLGCDYSRIHADDKTTPDDLINGYAFNYGVSSGVYGPLLSFGSLRGTEGYPMQITGSYQNGNDFKIRTHNGDNGTWHSWKTLLHTGNFDIVNPIVNTITTTSSGASNNIRLGDDCYIGDCNQSDTFRVAGIQNSGKGFIKFGDGAAIGYGGGTALDIKGNTWIGGSLDVTDNARVYNKLYFTASETGYYISASWAYSRTMIRAPHYVSQDVIAEGTLYSNRLKGLASDYRIYLGAGYSRLDCTDNNYARLYTAMDSGSDTGSYWSPYGGMAIKVNGVAKHDLQASGTKIGGSIEIEGMTYGMSPTDSPRSLIEDIFFDMNISGEVRIDLNPILAKSLERYAVFPSDGDVKILAKEKEYFIVKASVPCVCDFRIVGTRIDVKDQYYALMGGIINGDEKVVSY